MKILKMLEDDRIFSVERTGDAFTFQEECDQYFVVPLTRDEVLQLASELIALAEDEEI